MKVLALVVGTAGVGLYGYLVSTSGLLSTLTSCGVASSGVRDVAEAQGSGDVLRITRTIHVLRRICWLTGFLGLFISFAFAWPLSKWSFGNSGQASAIAFLGVSLLFTSISGGQMALLQGLRRIVDLAYINIFGAFLGTIASVALYYMFGVNGVAAGLVASAGLLLLCSWWGARKEPVGNCSMSWRETFSHAGPLLKLGLVLTWSTLLSAVVTFFTRNLVIKYFGVDASGVYQAAWGLSGLFSGFILSAMVADFFPRLTEASADNKKMTLLVNEQTQIGVLFSLSGLVVTIIWGRELIAIAYSKDFSAGSNLLAWMSVGVFGRVVSWPLGFILLAKRAARLYFITETLVSGVGVLVLIVLMKYFGLVGAGYAFALFYLIYTTVVLLICRRLIGFGWVMNTNKLIVAALSVIGVCVGLTCIGGALRHLLGGVVLAMVLYFTLCGLVNRLGWDFKFFNKAPRWLRHNLPIINI